MAEIETRYVNIKIQDAFKYLNEAEREIFDILCLKIDEGRYSDGKEHLQGLFISDDWAIYPEALEMVKKYIEEADATDNSDMDN